jgi:glutathione synthase/RimK-type ligase-like ATP-grasp enzyme
VGESSQPRAMADATRCLAPGPKSATSGHGMDIALLTYADAPALPPDDQLLLAPLRARGLTPHPVVWNDPAVDWSRFRLGVVRAVWDYFLEPAAFASWLERVEHRTELLNSPALLRWNAHKAYLVELAGRGVPVTPTALVRRGTPTSLSSLVAERGWADVVVKPAVSGAGRLTRHFVPGALAGEGQAHLEAVLAEGDALVQPFLSALQERGERSYLFIDGVFSHAVERPPTMGATGGVPDGEAMVPRPDELALATRVLEVVPTRTLYARVDVASGPDGAPVLQELEVIEPRLFLRQGPGSAERLADAIARRVALR